MTREQLEQALFEAVSTANDLFEGEDFEGSRDWHHRAVALHELLYGPIDPTHH
jgi:hypothetical protein